VKPTVQLPPPPVSLIEEWDNPAMTEFKRLEAEDRVTFAQSHTQEEWLAFAKESKVQISEIRLAPKPARQWPEKLVRLPW
jgi:hypothetical protein